MEGGGGGACVTLLLAKRVGVKEGWGGRRVYFLIFFPYYLFFSGGDIYRITNVYILFIYIFYRLSFYSIESRAALVVCSLSPLSVPIRCLYTVVSAVCRIFSFLINAEMPHTSTQKPLFIVKYDYQCNEYQDTIYKPVPKI